MCHISISIESKRTEEGATTEGGAKGLCLDPLKGTTQFVIPVLKPNIRIDGWEPLFRAAVTPLLLQENGESLITCICEQEASRN